MDGCRDRSCADQAPSKCTMLELLVLSADEIRSIFVPTLGSAVAEPFGAQWDSKRHDADDVENGMAPRSDARPGVGGMSVVVRVEKEVV